MCLSKWVTRRERLLTGSFALIHSFFSPCCCHQDGCESVAQVQGIQGEGGVESEEAAKCREVEKGKEGGEKEATCEKVC